MRRLSSVLVAIALAVLPFGGTAGRAMANAHAQPMPCHHAAEAGQATAVASPLHGGHHHQGDMTGHGAAEAGMHHHGQANPVSEPEPCPHCGPQCHCLAPCTAACGALTTDSAGAILAREIEASVVAPGEAAVPRSWTLRPWPPPPRA